MRRPFRLTRRAEDSLVGIAKWTIEVFGMRQADLYEAIAKGDAISRSCSALVGNVENLRYARAGEHFLVFLERPDEVIIVEILHSRCDLPRHVAALETLTKEGRQNN